MLDDEVNVLLTFITYRYDLITAKCSLGLAMALIPERANFLRRGNVTVDWLQELILMSA